MPTKEAIAIELSNNKTLTESEYANTKDLLNSLTQEDVEQQWLLDTTEKWCKDRAVYNAVLHKVSKSLMVKIRNIHQRQYLQSYQTH